MRHGLKHLRGGNHRLGHSNRGCNQILLNQRYALGGHLNAEVAACDHDAVGNRQDSVDILKRLRLLNFGDDWNRAMFVVEAEHNLAGFGNIDCLADKG